MTAINSESEIIEIATDVLVVGGGLTGMKAASGISDAGYNVTLVERNYELGGSVEMGGPVPGMGEAEALAFKTLEDKVAADSRIEILTQATLKKAAGTVGHFDVCLEKEDQEVERTVGAVVLATDTYIQPVHEKYGLTLSGSVITQTGLEGLLSSEAGKKELFEGKSVAIFSGLAQPSHPVALERSLRAARELGGIDGCAVFVLSDNLKVAASGLSKMYKEVRDEGINFFKLQELPRFEEEGSQHGIFFDDPVLRQAVSLTVDYVVVDEEFLPDPQNEFLAEALKVDLNGAGYLQMDNVHRFPVETNVKGVFVAGSGREAAGIGAAWCDVENVVSEISALMGDGKLALAPETAVVEPKKCAFCLTCYRCCPHGAISWDGESAIVLPQACQGCGICASECPMDAIQVGSYSDETIKSQVDEGLAAKSGASEIVAFCCMNSAYEAYDAAKAYGMPLPSGLKVVKVPCAGKIDSDYILSTFAKGADGVVVFACHNGNCKSENGSTFAGWRVNDIHNRMDVIGLERERLVFAKTASNMRIGFANTVNKAEADIKQLG